MYIAKHYLKKIIKEELTTLLKEETTLGQALQPIVAGHYAPESQWGDINYGSPSAHQFGFEGFESHLPGGRPGPLAGIYGFVSDRVPGETRWHDEWDDETPVRHSDRKSLARIATEMPGKFSDWAGPPAHIEAPIVYDDKTRPIRDMLPPAGLEPGHGMPPAGYPPWHQPKNWSEWSDKDLGIYGHTTGLDAGGNITLYGYQDQLHPVTQLPAYKREIYRRWLDHKRHTDRRVARTGEPYSSVIEFPPNPPRRIPEKYFDLSGRFDEDKYFGDWVRKINQEITDSASRRRIKIPPR